jgi:mono/diheme cytochrome c family protein
VVYKANCAGCHGNAGEGNGPAASSLKPKPANFVAVDYKDSKGKNPREYTDAELTEIIQNGRKGTAMPAWKKQLTADKINDVLAYVRSLAK